MKLLWTDRARRDLLNIGRFIARDNPRAARAWVERLRDRARRAAEMPLAGRIMPERAEQGIREVFVRNYRIVYRVSDDTVHVLTVFEGRRLFPDDAVADSNSDE
ncbi:MAG: type II toxin-antitoxin system RelE/ParE family toxin [Deltaproteobacteria bacterium]|nr:type II toxin-antitoxin system RelE/ParE family toxin [Deltaproteobacteria bacterium]MBN2674705.1 type II toxin-antitoxin system RelE/ParE family toxin [Deltaproteobacteria bacterium]